MHSYDHKKIERKWQRVWDAQKLYQARDGGRRKKFYALIEFPYPSGDGLHVGHPRPYIGMDIIARKRRMEGYNVLYPIGWDAFGLPTENYAIKTGIHPATVTKRNTKNFKRQIQSLGISFDWSREITTTDPKYYRWTQWFFLQFFKHGLAYKKKMPINWCLSCKIGLANEEVVDGRCERCGGETEKRDKEQWMLAITNYADRLDKDLDLVDYLPRIKTQQRNWIGRSEGTIIKFEIRSTKSETNSKSQIQNSKQGEVEVFTTRPDTLFGATYLVLSPEYKEIPNYKSQITNWGEVESYIQRAKGKTEIERTAEGKEKTGVELKGVKAINPANQETIPIWIADYVLAEYGTGAIMAVPAHDERDFQFARKYNLPIKMVICPHYPAPTCPVLDEAYLGSGHLVDSGKFTGMKSEEAKKAITEFVRGKTVTTFKLRDWVFSRQRYWGEPIPLLFCESCRKVAENSKSQAPRLPISGQANSKQSPKEPKYKFSEGELLNPGWIVIQDNKLPVKLPKVANYKPAETGESPLAAVSSWVNTKCPKCKGPAKRETDTMPNWAGSSWYYLRYLDPRNSKQFVGKKKLSYWSGDSSRASDSRNENQMLVTTKSGPVDWYNGGMEHTTLHLLYSRFWHKFLYDQKLVPTPEPYAKRTSHGLILAEDGEKMSKSKGNVINPDEIVKRFGADSLRVYEMFMGPFEQAISWSTDSLVGARRFLERVSRLKLKVESKKKRPDSELKSYNLNLTTLLHQTIQKVSDDIEQMKFNTAVSALMILVNAFEKEENIAKGDFETFLKLLAPLAPHLSEELWFNLGRRGSIHREPWPCYDEGALAEARVTIIVQVNGKVRGSFDAERGLSEQEMRARASALPALQKWIQGTEIKKVFVVKDRLVNMVAN